MKAIVTPRVIEVGAEDRLADFSGQIAERCASHAVVVERPRGEFLGVVRIHEAATRPSQRIFADLISEVPSCRVTKTEPRRQVLELVAKQNLDDAVVFSTRGKFVGVVTRESIRNWQLSSQETAVGKRAHKRGNRLAQSLKERLSLRTAALNQAISQLEEFSYAVAHDVRTPLRAMRGYAEALKEDYGSALDERANDHLQRIIRASHQLDRLMIGVLGYHEIARTNIVLRKVDLRRVVKQVTSSMAKELAGADVNVGELLSVRGDRALLVRCLTEFLSNALKFTVTGKRPSIRIETERAGGSVYLRVRDNGIGVKPEHRARIFQLFERVHGVDLFDGLGVGLALVRVAAEKMGGTAGVDTSDAGNGSCFWLRLLS